VAQGVARCEVASGSKGHAQVDQSEIGASHCLVDEGRIGSLGDRRPRDEERSGAEIVERRGGGQG
jgi:hypothetical protein